MGSLLVVDDVDCEDSSTPETMSRAPSEPAEMSQRFSTARARPKRALLLSSPSKARAAAKNTSLYQELYSKMAPKRRSTEPTRAMPRGSVDLEAGPNDGAPAQRSQTVGDDPRGISSSSSSQPIAGSQMRQRGTAKDMSDDSSGATATETPPAKKQGFFRHVEPKGGQKFTVENQIRRTLFSSYLNILLLAAPAGIALMYTPIDGKITFAVNFVAIVPLAAILSDCTEEIALRTGELLGGLINATFGNAVELIVAIIALAKNEIRVVQTSLIGSILSNLLLVLGMCFAFGGFNTQQQVFNQTSAQTAASLLALAVGSLILPTAFAQTDGISDGSLPKISHGLSIILLVVYGFYLLFQLGTHSEAINVKEKQSEADAKPNFTRREKEPKIKGQDGAEDSKPESRGQDGVDNQDPENQGQGGDKSESEDEEEEEEEQASLHIGVAFGVLLISTVLIAFCAEGMVGGIEAITKEGVSEEFVGLILVPIVGNACEHATAVTVAMKNKMDLAIGVAIGSSLQVALFLLPLLVVIGWGMGKEEMTLSFDVFQVVVLFVSVLLVNYLIGDGKSHWLEGVMLICMYFMIATCTWWYPHDYDSSTPGVQAKPGS